MRHNCGVILEGLMHQCGQCRCGIHCLIWFGGVVDVGNVDIDEARDRKVGGFVSLSRTEIVF